MRPEPENQAGQGFVGVPLARLLGCMHQRLHPSADAAHGKAQLGCSSQARTNLSKFDHVSPSRQIHFPRERRLRVISCDCLDLFWFNRVNIDYEKVIWCVHLCSTAGQSISSKAMGTTCLSHHCTHSIHNHPSQLQAGQVAFWSIHFFKDHGYHMSSKSLYTQHIKSPITASCTLARHGWSCQHAHVLHSTSMS